MVKIGIKMLQVCYRCCNVTKQPRIVTKNAPPKEGALMEILFSKGAPGGRLIMPQTLLEEAPAYCETGHDY